MAENKDGEFYKPMERGSPSKGGFREFMYNSGTGEFCGRTCMSWCKITLFYIVFYLCLTAFWTIMLVIFYQSLDAHEPSYMLDRSRIGNIPGLGFRPSMPRKNVDSTLIAFTHGSDRNKEAWEHWPNALASFLQPYNETKKTTEYFTTCQNDQKLPEKRVCAFPIDKMDANCTKERNFGYDIGHPCVLIKLNNIYGWAPEPYDNGSIPKGLTDHIGDTYDPRNIYITCDGENAADKENMGTVSYYPSNAIPNYYFPFTNLEGYLAPFIFVHFHKPAFSILINIECKAWAKNIKHDRMERKGSVHFELLVD